MKAYRIRARCTALPETDWREQLTSRLGGRPRRMGRWAELGLHGALECLAKDGENTLAAHAALVVSSQNGPAGAMHDAWAQAREGLPQPLTFLQTQPSQLLAALSAQLRWRGDARFITHPDSLTVLTLALTIADSHADGLLVGWVNELETESSVWLRMEPVKAPFSESHGPGNFVRRDFTTLVQEASHLRLGPSGLEVIIGP
jgi:hypothetical protein